jgi:hypothetical protein
MFCQALKLSTVTLCPKLATNVKVFMKLWQLKNVSFN